MASTSFKLLSSNGITIITTLSFSSTAIRSGDYYMFDDLDDDDITDIVADTEIERKEAEQLPEDIRDERMTIMEVRLLNSLKFVWIEKRFY